MRPWNSDGWDWFETAADPAGVEPASAEGGDDLAALAARCFRGADGHRLLTHLRRVTLERTLAPDASVGRLRHLEGQRHIVKHIEALVGAGIAGAATTSSN